MSSIYQHFPRVEGSVSPVPAILSELTKRSLKLHWSIKSSRGEMKGECKSLLKNFARAMLDSLRGSLSTTGTPGPLGAYVEETSGAYTPKYSAVNLKGSTLMVGTSNTAVNSNNSALVAKVQQSAGTFLLESESPSSLVLSYSAPFVASGALSIREVGLASACEATEAGNPVRNWLMVRDVVPQFDVADSEAFTVKFSFTWTSDGSAAYTSVYAKLLCRQLFGSVSVADMSDPWYAPLVDGYNGWVNLGTGNTAVALSDLELVGPATPPVGINGFTGSNKLSKMLVNDTVRGSWADQQVFIAQEAHVEGFKEMGLYRQHGSSPGPRNRQLLCARVLLQTPTGSVTLGDAFNCKFIHDIAI